MLIPSPRSTLPARRKDPAVTPPPPETLMQVGAWLGEPPAVDYNRVLRYQDWLERPLDMLVLYGSHGDYNNVMGKLATQCTHHGNRPWKINYGVPLAWSGVATIQQIAAGQEDALYLQMAQYMVDNGMGSADLRIGWEFNGANLFAWSMLNAPLVNGKRQDWVNAYKRVVDIFRSIPGNQFTFSWSMANQGGNNPEEAWPSDGPGVGPTSYVDVVDLDLYDQSFNPQTWQTRINLATAGNGVWAVGLDRVQQIATDAGDLPIGFGEWGLTTRHDPGSESPDNELWIPFKEQWMLDHKVKYHCYFHGSELGQSLVRWTGSQYVDELGTFPNSQPMYKAAFGGTPQPQPTLLTGVWIGEVDNARVLAYESWFGAQIDMMTMYAAHTYRPDAMSKLTLQCTRHGGRRYKALYGVNLAWPGYSTLADVAAGSDDALYLQMAQYMVDNGLGNAELRLGWEFNGGWYDWSMLNAPLGANNKRVVWIDAYRRVADIFKGVAGNSFKLTWCVANDGGNNPEEAWPTYTAGITPTAYVDVVDIDTYDQSFNAGKTWQDRWNDAVNGVGNSIVGLDRLKGIANSGGVPVGIGEYGLTTRHTAGNDIDNEIYFPNMHQWCLDNEVAYQAYFHGTELNQRLCQWTGSQYVDEYSFFPNAGPMFKQYFVP